MKPTAVFTARLFFIVLFLALTAFFLDIFLRYLIRTVLFILRSAGMEIGDETVTEWLFRQDFYGLLLVIMVVSLLYAFVRYISRRDFFKHSRFYPPKGKSLMLAVFIGISTVFLSEMVLRVTRRMFPETLAALQSRFEVIAESEVMPMMFAVVVFAPFFEEIFFRGILFRVFEQHRASLWTSLVLTSFLFAVYQMNVIDGLYAFTLGLVIGLSFIWSASLWVPITIHFVHNGFSTLFQRGDLDWLLTAVPGLETYISYLFVFLLLPLSLWRLHRLRPTNPRRP